MSYGRVLRSSAPVNWSREMGEYQLQEAIRVMGYRFERPSSKGLVIRRPTPAEREAHDPSIEALREERGAMERARAAKARSEASFAASRKRALESMARCARMRKGSGKKGLAQRQGGVECHS